MKAAARLLGVEPSAPSGGTTPDGTPWTPRPQDIIEFPEPMRLAEHYLKHCRTRDQDLTIRRYREQWWAFEQGGYRSLADEIALVDMYQHVDKLRTPERDKETKEALGTYKRLVARSSTVAEVAKAIPAEN